MTGVLGKYAEVAVDAPLGHTRTFSYSIPSHIHVEPGQLVWVPLGPRPVQGVVFRLANAPQVEQTRDIIGAVGPTPVAGSEGLRLAEWISDHYMSPLFDAVALLLPPGFQGRVRTLVSAPPLTVGAAERLDTEERAFLEELVAQGEVDERTAVSSLGKGGENVLRRLAIRGLVRRRWELRRPPLSHRYERYVVASAWATQGTGLYSASGPKRPRRLALLERLAEHGVHLPYGVAVSEYGPSAVDGLVRKGLAALEWVRVDIQPPGPTQPGGDEEGPVVLTAEQRRAVGQVCASLDGTDEGGPSSFLLFGVTGSGKTEVYLRCLEHCVRSGRRGIFLVPEISLTPQTLHRLEARFPGRVAVVHSGMSPREQFDQWWRVRDGEYDVVVGARSALFAPIPDLGLIVVDEEHEWTYKQGDASPHYHARDAALKLARLTGSKVVMGSATPDVVTYHRAKSGVHGLLELPARTGPPVDGGREPPSLAEVEVCDMRQELREGNRGIFSLVLSAALVDCIAAGQQAILFLNRRGAATVVQCRDCGGALRCRRCAVPLAYHIAEMRLLCHQCNRRTRPPRVCPVCRSPHIRYLGLGTQRVVDEVKRLLPEAAVLRWDRDAAQGRGAHEGIMGQMVSGKVQVLVGTQMVAKGLHLPRVSLVGVVLADIGLHLPDYRAGERAFQLLCQVAGRAGRGSSRGRVILQTYSPESYPIRAAAAQDYAQFYRSEVQFRRELRNPPFARLVHLVYLHTNLDACQREALRMGRALRNRADIMGFAGLEMVGPAPAYPERVRGKYRWHLVLRGSDPRAFLSGVAIPKGWTVDVDPVSVM